MQVPPDFQKGAAKPKPAAVRVPRVALAPPELVTVKVAEVVEPAARVPKLWVPEGVMARIAGPAPVPVTGREAVCVAAPLS